MDLTDFLKSQMQQSLSPSMVEQMSHQLGVKPEQASQAAGSAMSVLLSALARNAATPAGANALNNALERDNHDSILDMLGGVLGGGNSPASSAGGLGDLLGGLLGGGGAINSRAANGGGILEHILGRRKEDTAEQIGQRSGIGTGNALKIMAMLAPIVMGMIGKTKKQGKLGADGLGGLLDSFMRSSVQPQKPASQTNIGLAGRLLDRDGDGSALDDIAGMLGGFLSRR